MSAKHSKNISLISAISDLAILNIGFVISYCYINAFDSRCLSMVHIVFYIYLNIAWLISSAIFRTYSIHKQIYKKEILFASIKSIVFFFFLFLLFFQAKSLNYFQRDEIKILFTIFSITLILFKFLLFYVFYLYRKLGYNYRNVVIVGYNNAVCELRDYFISNPWAGYRFKGFFTQEKINANDIIGNYSNLESYIAKNDIDEIYILIGEIQKGLSSTIASVISKYPVKLRIVPDLSDFSFMRIKLEHYDTLPVMQIQQGPLNFWYNILIKRIFDILFSLFVIVLILSWLIPLIYFINLIIGEKSLFFIQKRTGINDKTFRCIKFRTMIKNSLSDSDQSSKDDGKITSVGKFLRRNSIDEMPQFFNVLIGRMSVVGPRPHMLKHTDIYKKLVQKFMLRHTIKPGISGHAQVRGHRGTIKELTDMEERVKFDVTYIEKWSLWFDVKIIFLTVINIIKGDNKAT
ncbi:MAG: exopolysaccharide biosynthesis polyprenyl glycosylphosphotransferase [Bacteroidota bacterium]|nr:exopolysaccharide biosynthesis polyprenyl glycosylphosphotransferase [Bacteroidota bacterium]